MGKSHSIQSDSAWMEELRSIMPLLGHRNWILVVDKAFPLQSASGMSYINTEEDLFPVLDTVLTEIKTNSPHIKPIVYNDLELEYITEDMVEGIDGFRGELQNMLRGFEVQTLLHEEVFSKLDTASKLFEVIVIKTEVTMPYTSIFIELDCGYWSAEKENKLRKNLEKG